jgi:hypothetical protein
MLRKMAAVSRVSRRRRGCRAPRAAAERAVPASRPGDDQVRPQRDERLQARVQPAADRGEVRDLRVRVVVGAGDQPVAGAERDQRLGGRRQQRDDRARGAGRRTVRPRRRPPPPPPRARSEPSAGRARRAAATARRAERGPQRCSAPRDGACRFGAMRQKARPSRCAGNGRSALPPSADAGARTADGPAPLPRGVCVRERRGPVSWLEAASLAFPGSHRLPEGPLSRSLIV